MPILYQQFNSMWITLNDYIVLPFKWHLQHTHIPWNVQASDNGDNLHYLTHNKIIYYFYKFLILQICYVILSLA